MQSLFVLSTQQSILRVKNGLLLDVNFVHSALLDIHVCRIHNIFSKRVKKRLTFVHDVGSGIYSLSSLNKLRLVTAGNKFKMSVQNKFIFLILLHYYRDLDTI